MSPRSFVKLQGDIGNICCCTKHTSKHRSSRTAHMSTQSLQCFWLVDLDFHATLTSGRCAASPSYHALARHFHLAFLFRSCDVGRECKICLPACGRYTINCGIPSMQYTQIDRAEVARCTLSVSCSTDLNCCVADDRVGVFLEHVHRTLKASERFTPDFPSFFFILLAFWLP